MRDGSTSPGSGFTLTEVIVALMVLELGLLGVAGLALHAHGLLSDASLRSRAVAVAAEVADSLAAAGVASGGGRSFVGGSVSWTVAPASGEGSGGEALRKVSITATDPGGGALLSVQAVVPTADPLWVP